MASFDFDQAEGLRRMLAGPKPRIVTFLSATPADDKAAMLVNLGASLAQAGNDVMIVDACQRDAGVARRLRLERHVGLLQVARQECTLEQTLRIVPQGFALALLAREQTLPAPDSDEACRLAQAFDLLVKRQGGIVIVDGELNHEGGFAVPLLADSEIVVQVSTSAASITNAYGLIKRLAQELGSRSCGVLVTGASEVEARVVYDNMAAAASRYLKVDLICMGAVPADEYLHRAIRLGRSVVDAFPLAGASVAFRQLAGRFSLNGIAHAERSGAQCGS